MNALLAKGGMSATRHSGVRALFGQHFVRSGKVSPELGALYNDLYETRHETDYRDFFCAEAEAIRPLIDHVRQFLVCIEELIAPAQDSEDKEGG